MVWAASSTLSTADFHLTFYIFEQLDNVMFHRAQEPLLGATSQKLNLAEAIAVLVKIRVQNFTTTVTRNCES